MYTPVRVGGALCVLWVVSGLEVVLVVVLARGLVEEGVVIETSALTKRCAGEGHARCCLAVTGDAAARRVQVSAWNINPVVLYLFSSALSQVLRYTIKALCTLLSTPGLLSSLSSHKPTAHTGRSTLTKK